MQEKAREIRSRGQTIAFVPTMGFLHEGHASLLREGRNRADILVLSIFVNPTQFGAGEDFEAYPRNLERDSLIAQEAGVDCIFAPCAREMYPEGYQTRVHVENLTLPLCGASRPGHFQGVTTVVAKLCNIVMPHVAFFGEKDFQQLAVIRRMVSDLNMDMEIVGMPIIREADGLAMSSRNRYLAPDERKRATSLFESLCLAAELVARGERSAAAIAGKMRAVIGAVQPARIDYVALADPETLEPVEEIGGPTLAAVAAVIGRTRLIDNLLLQPPAG